jgi:hypothetical protein
MLLGDEQGVVLSGLERDAGQDLGFACSSQQPGQYVRWPSTSAASSGSSPPRTNAAKLEYTSAHFI